MFRKTTISLARKIPEISRIIKTALTLLNRLRNLWRT